MYKNCDDAHVLNKYMSQFIHLLHIRMKDSDTHSSIFTYVLAVADEPRNVCRIKLLPFYETPPKKKKKKYFVGG